MLRSLRRYFSRRVEVLVIVGPSGVGKGTIINKLHDEYQKSFGFSVSHTSRAPRKNEIEGVHYYFKTREWMEKEILLGNFLESATVHGNIYGTSKLAVEDVVNQKKICILDIDLQGAKSIYSLKLRHKVRFIYIRPPSMEDLEKRLAERNTEAIEEVARRMRNSEKELTTLDGEIRHIFDAVIINRDLNQCYQEVLCYLDRWNAKLEK
mmetsp:Transcript_25785/g.40240  ORF Transcript_25785/g.40240 Transcript_25785/m.40240 type:complete len:208 (-) Transcript_25785:42-665(-)